MILSQLKRLLISKGYQMLNFDVAETALEIERCYKRLDEILSNHERLSRDSLTYADDHDFIYSARQFLIAASNLVKSRGIKIDV